MAKSVQIFVRSPDHLFPTKSLTLPSDSAISPSRLLSLLPLPQTLAPDSLYFTLNGRLFAPSSRLSHSSTLLLRLRLPGGGGDGGSTCAESRDCYLNMYSSKKPDKVDPNEARLSKFTTCSLSNEPLTPPVVIDKLGNLFNKEVLVQALLLKKQLPKEFAHIRGLKDMIEVKIGEKFECPITGLEFSSGKYGFFAVTKCGHVLSVKAEKEVKGEEGRCLVCGEGFEEKDRVVINGSEEEVKLLRERMEEEEKGRVKVKKEKKSKTKRASEGEEKVGGEKKFRAVDVAPKHATKEVYASIFTSSRKGELKETYSCRSLPLGRN